MDFTWLLLISLQIFVSQVSAFNLHPAYRTLYGAVPYQYQPAEYYPSPRYAEQAYPPPAPQQLVPTTPKPSPPANSVTALVEEPQRTAKFNSTILEAVSSNLKNGTTGKLDSGVLNNLAIALQLLIVSNLLNSSPDLSKNSTALASLQETLAMQKGLPHYHQHVLQGPSIATYPNANFLGSSGFAEPSAMSIFSGPHAPAAAPRHLKSPYEAIATPLSPFDKYSSFTSDFHSPYQANHGHEPYSFDSDLFS